MKKSEEQTGPGGIGRPKMPVAGETFVDRNGKLYYSITEVADMAGVKPHVLRYWETEFPALKPKKNRAGNRTYRERDVKLVLLIRKLLYDEGFTIRGALRRIRERKGEDIEQIEIPFIAAPPSALEKAAAKPATVERVSSGKSASLAQIRRELEGILADLSA
ncbi:MAG TPA: MerR family transcriptional regulator [bacterium]|nr:MerR family transcriptional regulator [bacterium]